jgi:Fic family protein
MIETPQRIEPARLEDVPEALSDLIAEIASAAAKLETSLHPKTAASLAQLVRIMNSYYSNLIEGNNTKPKDIERALAGDIAHDKRRDFQIEAAAHVRLQAEIDRKFDLGSLPEPCTPEFICWLHKEFYRDSSAHSLMISEKNRIIEMVPGQMRQNAGEDVTVGRHQPPSSEAVSMFMAYFADRYRMEPMGKAARILAIPAAHHRLNYIHPFSDGNGRVSRLVSHAMVQTAGIGAYGLWSISRGLARGLESRTDYKRMMDHADLPRQGDLDGRGNLSQRALVEFTSWFLQVCLDQIRFMSGLLEIGTLTRRLKSLVEKSDALKPGSFRLLEEALIRGEFERGDAARITGAPERTARRILNDAIEAGLLASDTPKGPVSLRFTVESQDILFPRLFSES